MGEPWEFAGSTGLSPAHTALHSAAPSAKARGEMSVCRELVEASTEEVLLLVTGLCCLCCSLIVGGSVFFDARWETTTESAPCFPTGFD